jgi:hypothetical protein
MNTDNKTTKHDFIWNSFNLHMVFQKLNANVKTEDRYKGRNRNGGHVSWPRNKNKAFQYDLKGN